MSTLTILVDTREKTPWTFPGIQTRFTKLRFGDYSAVGLMGVFEIERKSPMDLVSTLTMQWRRWVRKLFRWECASTRRIVIVEGTYQQCTEPRYDVIRKSKGGFQLMRAEFDRRLALTQLTGVSILFCGDRKTATQQAVTMLTKELATRRLAGKALTAEFLLERIYSKQKQVADKGDYYKRMDANNAV